MSERHLAGIYGKLPSRGDFVRRHLPDTFIEPWDAWLQTCLRESRDSLGETWLDLYLESPVWHFALDPSIAGPHGVSGIVIPSVDSVGRYFPFTLATILQTPTRAFHLRHEKSWYHQAAELALSVLEPDFAFDDFLKALDNLTALKVDPTAPAGELWAPNNGFEADHLTDMLKPCCVFWHEGPEPAEKASRQGATLLATRLPSSGSFAKMLRGQP